MEGNTQVSHVYWILLISNTKRTSFDKYLTYLLKCSYFELLLMAFAFSTASTMLVVLLVNNKSRSRHLY